MAKCNLSAGDIHTAEGKKHEKRHLTHFCTYPYFLCLAIRIPQVHNTTHQRRNCLSLSISNQTLLSLWALNWNSNDHASAKLRIALSLTATGHAPLSQVLFFVGWYVQQRDQRVSQLWFSFFFLPFSWVCFFVI